LKVLRVSGLRFASEKKILLTEHRAEIARITQMQHSLFFEMGIDTDQIS